MISMATEEDARELPEDQCKIEDDDRKDKPDIQTMERAEELASQYEDIKDRTVDGNTVVGYVKQIDTARANNNIVVTVDLPAEEADKKFRFSKPKVWSEDYDFVRWINYYDYDADSFPLMLQDECEVEVSKEKDGYDLVIPDKESSLAKMEYIRDKVGGLINSVHATYISARIPISLLLVAPWAIHAIAAVFGLISYNMSGMEFAGIKLILGILLIILFVVEDTYLESKSE